MVRADILHVELPDVEHARRFARLRSKDSQHGALRTQIADDERGRLIRLIRFAAITRLVVVQAQPAGRDGDLQAFQMDVAYRDGIAQESHEPGFGRE